MITYIKINGFKSFHNFEMEFTPLTVIAGVNASGKSNLFDALKLLSRLAEVDLKSAFTEQRGNPNELFTKYGEDDYAEEIEFTVDMLVNRKIKDNWGDEIDLKDIRLRYELRIKREKNEKNLEDLFVNYECLSKIKKQDDKWIENIIPLEIRQKWPRKLGGSSKPYIGTNPDGDKSFPTIKLRQDGRQGGRNTPVKSIRQTVLSSINSIDFPHVLAVKEEMRSWKYLQLVPEDIREPTQQDINIRDTITPSGKNLAAALFRIKQDEEYALIQISRTLNNFIPNIKEVNVKDDRANLQFVIQVTGEDNREFSSRVLSEGTLRLLTLCILQYDQQHNGLLCFEEPENGIHPFRIKAMVKLLKDLTVDFYDEEMPLRQVIVNTHSPVLVSAMIEFQQDKNVSIWLSRINTLVTKIKDKRIKIAITKFLPVVKEITYQMTLPITKEESKLTLREVTEYLRTTDAERAINAIS